MAKRKDSKKTSDKKKKQPPKRKSHLLMAVIVGALLISALWFVSGQFSGGGDTLTKSFSINGGEVRTVLDPSQFYGKARSAYAAAQEIPQILDKLYCYCYCDEAPTHHKSLLSCFVTNHGAG